ncbi:MAG TPA: S1 family peptidase [Actinophytocola sp.]|uniref:S1 family peptidase n=1 Tax=Actinophytocola sp. TaxID=1872138 RepID=UPI002DB923EA|nr:S1 family peptidase [Actinophytocola sp.]HEU5471730.1 S1 family peptidase [Actinophytocola sp.]
MAAPQSSAMFDAMQADLGLSADAALARIGQENRAVVTEAALTARLAGSYAGSWFDSTTGKLTVATTDASQLQAITATGATAKLMARSAAQLSAVQATLDAATASVPDTVAGWYVDAKSNSVVVEVVGNDAAGLAWAAGKDVRVEHVAAKPQTFWNLIGGQAINGGGARCSLAFSGNAGSTRYILTAGHCGELGGTWTGSGGTIGPVANFSFPTNDYARIRITSTAAVQTSLVDRYSSGSDVTVAGSTPAAIGSSICRSGSTTGWRCGVVQANNQTVNYGGGDIVGGLTRTTVCAQPGDSGGAYVSPNGATRVQAQGITSGGSGNCTSGGITFHQPVREALSAYGLTLITG